MPTLALASTEQDQQEDIQQLSRNIIKLCAEDKDNDAELYTILDQLQNYTAAALYEIPDVQSALAKHDMHSRLITKFCIASENIATRLFDADTPQNVILNDALFRQGNLFKIAQKYNTLAQKFITSPYLRDYLFNEYYDKDEIKEDHDNREQHSLDAAYVLETLGAKHLPIAKILLFTDNDNILLKKLTSNQQEAMPIWVICQAHPTLIPYIRKNNKLMTIINQANDLNPKMRQMFQNSSHNPPTMRLYQTKCLRGQNDTDTSCPSPKKARFKT